MKYLFGKDIKRKFFPEENDAPVELPTQTPTIYIFDSEPSREDALAGTGAIQTISTWSEDSQSPWARTYTISAIADPSSTGTVDGAWYWEAIKHITKTSGTSQVLIRAFFLELTSGNEATPGTSVRDVIDNYPAITSYLSQEEITQFLSSALSELRADLESKGIQWSLVSEMHKFKLAIAYKTISLCSYSQFTQEGDKFVKRADLYEGKYIELLNKIDLPYDKNRDGKPETLASASDDFVVISR